jgi:hypothetical protein
VVGFVVDKAKKIWAKMTGAGKKKEEPPKNQKEHDAQVKAGLAALEGEQRKADKDNDSALTFEEAEGIAKKVKQQYPVFKSITVVDGGESWDYDYVASPGQKKKGLKKEGESTENKISEDIYIQNRVEELKESIPEAQKGRITMAAGLAKKSPEKNIVLIGTSEPRGYLRPGVTLKPGEVKVLGDSHAEQNIVSYIIASNLKLINIGATRPVCSACVRVIKPTKARIVTPLKD